jgi:hypothetical protein
MPRQVPAPRVPVYQIKVTLKGSKPPIWRRILVASDTRLGKLHRILQDVMGWTDSHLHQFIVGQTYYGVPDPDFDLDVRSERTVPSTACCRNQKTKSSTSTISVTAGNMNCSWKRCWRQTPRSGIPFV